MWTQALLAHGERDFLVGAENLGVGALAASVAEEARVFASFGIGERSSVAVRIPPSITQIESVLALWSLGAQVIVLDHRLRAAELDAVFGAVQPQFVVSASSQPHGGVTLTHRPRYEILTSPRAGGRPAATDHCVVQCSSGSTGRYKLIGRTPQSLLAEVNMLAQLPDAPTLGDRVLLLNSTAHSFGLIAGILTALHTGAVVVFSPVLSAPAIETTLREHDATLMFGAPLHWALLADGAPLRLPSLRAVVNSGERISPDVAQRFTDRFGIAIGQSYGTTETGVIAMDISGRLHPGVGPLAPGIEARTVDGELQVALPQSPYLTGEGAQRYVDGWFHTMDRAQIDEQRNVTLFGRTGSLIDRGGLTVDLGEVETVLNRHPSVRGSVVLHHGVIECFAELGADSATTADDLRRWLAARLAAHKLPASINVVPELPRTMNGKLVRHREALLAVKK